MTTPTPTQFIEIAFESWDLLLLQLSMCGFVVLVIFCTWKFLLSPVEKLPATGSITRSSNQLFIDSLRGRDDVSEESEVEVELEEVSEKRLYYPAKQRRHHSTKRCQHCGGEFGTKPTCQYCGMPS